MKYEDVKTKYGERIARYFQLYVDMRRYYYLKARCAVTEEESEKAILEFEKKDADLLDDDNVPAELYNEPDLCNMIFKEEEAWHRLSDLHNLDRKKISELKKRRLKRVRENVTAEDRKKYADFKRYVFEEYHGEFK